jgi:hypothetical protein
VLTGRALDQLALIVWAFVRAFQRGVGRGDGTARLTRVVRPGIEETVVLDSPTATLAEHDTRVPPITASTTDRLTLVFDTPLRLQNGGRRATVEEHTPRRLLMALVRRIALLHEFHGPGPLPLDFSGLARQAETLGDEKDVRWRDWTRYSTRQRQKIDLGGVVGRWTLHGNPENLRPFLPFLHLGQWLHVGKEATFGMGGYHLDTT